MIGTNVPAECDVIMKGGVTSGVVYPLALVEIAEKHRIRNIGGTSAGAIAAAFGAAAELGRQTSGAGFALLSSLPTELGKDLLGLFQPTVATRPLLAIALAFVGKEKGFVQRLWAVTWSIVRAERVAYLCGTLPAVWLLVRGILDRDPVVTCFGILAVATLGVAAAAIAMALNAWTGTLRDNYFGLCTGMKGEVGGDQVPLTPWLHDKLTKLATVEGALTFGHLSEQGVNLEMVTSNITSGRPHRLPTLDGTFYFSKSEWLNFFPEDVIKQIAVKKGPVVGKVEDLFEMPDKDSLPVLVAVRMSLSFPGLLSAVPLYGVEHYDQDKHQLVKCWFSDGGLISNFPIHFFDAVWPRRPTFALDLCGPRASTNGRPAPLVWLPKVGDHVELPVANIDSLKDFIGALVDAMQSWSDNLYSQLPGFRERIAHIALEKDEGGLNLEMTPDAVTALAQRGEAAAQLFEEFNWDQHRWTRFLSSMYEFRHVLEGMLAAFDGPTGLDGFLSALPNNMKIESYLREPPWVASAREAARALVALSTEWEKAKVIASAGEKPNPPPVLHVGPRL